RVDGPTPHAQIHAVHRHEAAELLGQPLGLEDRVGHRSGWYSASRRSRQALLASAVSQLAMQAFWARTTSSTMARGSRGNDSWSSRVVWAVAVGAALRTFAVTRASVASTSAGGQTQLTRPIARASWGDTS